MSMACGILALNCVIFGLGLNKSSGLGLGLEDPGLGLGLSLEGPGLGLVLWILALTTTLLTGKNSSQIHEMAKLA